MSFSTLRKKKIMTTINLNDCKMHLNFREVKLCSSWNCCDVISFVSTKILASAR